MISTNKTVNALPMGDCHPAKIAAFLKD